MNKEPLSNHFGMDIKKKQPASSKKSNISHIYINIF